jgi:hypothetical protein
MRRALRHLRRGRGRVTVAARGLGLQEGDSRVPVQAAESPGSDMGVSRRLG